MFTKYYKCILFVLGVFLTTPLYAANYVDQDEGKNDTEETLPKQKGLSSYYNYTLQYSKKKIGHIVASAELEEEKKYLKNNHIVDHLKHKQETVFFIVIASNNKTQELSKFFFINRAPSTEKDAIRRAEKACGCNVISHIKPKTSPHIIFQLLGWLAQEEKRYMPIFIHSNAAICCTCEAIVSSLFKIKMPSNTKGCNGLNSIDLADTFPLAQQYMKGELTFPLAKKLLLPTLRLTYENKVKQLESTEKKQKEQLSAILLEKNNLATQCNRLTTQKNSLQNNYDNLNRDKDNLQDNYNVLENSYNDLKNKEQLLKKSYNNLNRDKDNLQNRYNVLDNSYNNLTTQKDALVENNRSLKKEKKSRCKLFTTLCSIVIAISSVVQYSYHNNRYNALAHDYNISKSILKESIEVPYSPLYGHKGSVKNVAISSDNTYIVSGSWDQTICIWDFETGEELPYSPLKGYKGLAWSVAISSDNQYIVSGDTNNAIRIWDFKTGKEISYSPLNGHVDWVRSVTISSDNRYIVSGSGDKMIRLWDMKKGEELSCSPLTGHKDWVTSVAISTDNRYIVGGSKDKTIRIWNFKIGQELSNSPLYGHKDIVKSMVDNKYIVSGSRDKTISIWDRKLLKYLHQAADKEDNEALEID